MSSKELDDVLQDNADKQLALSLGISYEDLCELTWEIGNNESSDGLVYEYLVQFDPDSPAEILSKIEGIDDSLVVRLPPSEFDSE